MKWTKRGFWTWFLGSDVLAPVSPAGTNWADSKVPLIDPALLQDHPTALAAAVEDFNARAADDEVGRTQLPLTADEVTTAIRSAGRHQLPLIESQRRALYRIAETGEMPPWSALRFTTNWLSPAGFRCEVWWIDLILCSPGILQTEQDGSVCSLRIRDHRLRSWPDPGVTIPKEIQRLQADQRWFGAEPAEQNAPRA